MKETVISIQGLTKRYQTDPPFFALKDIYLRVSRKEIFGIVGMSGAGKSTLMRCLVALEKVSEGKVFIRENEITALSKNALLAARKKIGMIFQHFNLFSSRTVLENVAYPFEIDGVSKKERFSRARRLLALVGLKEKEKHYPSQLSGGEKQRVAIARAVANEPEVLLCDEATSSLDLQNKYAILDLLSELNQTLGLTILLITHEMDVVKRICSHVAVMEHGEIVEQDAVEKLFTRPKHPTTQHLLQKVIHEVPLHFDKKGKNSTLLRLCFTGVSAEEPIICRLIRRYAVEVNILLGGIDRLKKQTIGNLIVELIGDIEECHRARAFLETQGVVCSELLC